MKKNNQGFTLIELVVVIAIIGIFMGVVLNYVTGGSNSYRNTSGNSRAQIEVQETLDQLQELIIDANRSVFYAQGKLSDGIPDTAFEEDFGSPYAGSKTFYACNVKEVNGELKEVIDAVVYDPENKQLLYSRNTGVVNGDESSQDPQLFADGLDSGQPDSGSESTKETVLAKNVVEFAVDVTKVTTENIVRFKIIVDDHGKTVVTDHEVHLRNNIKVAPPENSFNNPSDPSEPLIKIISHPSFIYNGDTGTLRCHYANIDKDSIEWSISGEGATIIGKDDTRCIILGNVTEEQTVKIIVSGIISIGPRKGEEISAEVDVRILPKQQEAEKNLTISGPRILAAPGAHTNDTVNHSLRDILTVTLSDGSNVSGDCSWSLISSAVEGISFDQGSSTVSVGASAGGHSNAMTFRATYNDNGKQLSAEYMVSFAQLNITSPSNGGSYQVGDPKSFNAAVFVDGSLSGYQVGQNSWMLQRDSTVTNGSFQGDTFVIDDMGIWKVAVSYSDGDINGILNDSIEFEVENKPVLTLSGPSTLVAGDTYSAGIYGNWFIIVKGLEEAGITNLQDQSYKFVWSVEGNTSEIEIKIDDEGRGMYFSIGEGEQGFVLKLQILKNGKELAEVSKNIRIARIELLKPNVDTIYVSEPCKCEVQLYVSECYKDSNGRYAHQEFLIEDYPGYEGITYQWTFDGQGFNQNTKAIEWTPRETRNGYPIEVKAVTGDLIWGGEKLNKNNMPLRTVKKVNIVTGSTSDDEPVYNVGDTINIEMGKASAFKLVAPGGYTDDVRIYIVDSNENRTQIYKYQSKDYGLELIPNDGTNPFTVSVKFTGQAKKYYKFVLEQGYGENETVTTFINTDYQP